MGDGELLLPLDLPATPRVAAFPAGPAPLAGPAPSLRLVQTPSQAADDALRRAVEEVRERSERASREHAAMLRAALTVLDLCEAASTDPPVACEEAESPGREDAEYVLAQTLSATIGSAAYLLTQARTATDRFPRTFVLLEEGRLPVRWHQRLLRLSAGLTEASLAVLDATVARWDVPGMGESRFRRRLGLELRRLRDRERVEESEPQPERSVHTDTPDQEDGTACLIVRGPAPEILALGHRLDAVARAVRTAQRQAVQDPDGAPIPFDDGTVAATGVPLPLARLRYEVLTRSMLDSEGVEVPEERFRLSVTVPVTTLLGIGEEPGLLDGRVPLPAAMARGLAAGETTWYRVLTDPVHGTFLPLPADRYHPTPAMLEHLRQRDPVCAVPGCGRPVRHGAEADHIEEFDHLDPAAGGATEVENLHLLCRRHHQRKTDGALDPRRDTHRAPGLGPPDRPPDAPGCHPPGRPSPEGAAPGSHPAGASTRHPPGRTTWTRGNGDVLDPVVHEDEADMMTPFAVRSLDRAWDRHLDLLERRRTAAEQAARGLAHPYTGPPPF